jgi:hypothetical protein
MILSPPGVNLDLDKVGEVKEEVWNGPEWFTHFPSLQS